MALGAPAPGTLLQAPELLLEEEPLPPEMLLLPRAGAGADSRESHDEPAERDEAARDASAADTETDRRGRETDTATDATTEAAEETQPDCHAHATDEPDDGRDADTTTQPD